MPYCFHFIHGFNGSPDSFIELRTNLFNKLNGKHVGIVYSYPIFGSPQSNIIESIKKYNDYDHILIGHSHGGDSILEVFEKNLEFTAFLVILLDPVGLGNKIITDNIKHAINLYVRGGFPDKTYRRATNIDANHFFGKRLTHTSIDNDKDVHNFIINVIVDLEQNKTNNTDVVARL